MLCVILGYIVHDICKSCTGRISEGTGRILVGTGWILEGNGLFGRTLPLSYLVFLSMCHHHLTLYVTLSVQTWMKEHNVLSIVLRDNLHQPQVSSVAFIQVLFTTKLLSQYVEKLEKILRFCIKEHSLSVEDLDAIWACQVGNVQCTLPYENLTVCMQCCYFAWVFSAWVHIWPDLHACIY